MELAGLYLYAYLVGSVPTAYVIARLVKGVDIRRFGSGQVGGSNLVRCAGKWWLVPLGLFELLVKGASPVLLAQHWLGLDRGSLELLIAPLLALAGHNWSVFLNLHGGRGIAVTVGALLVLSPPLLAGFLAVFGMGWLITRSAGVWTLVALAMLPVWAALAAEPVMISWYCVAMLALVVLKRLLSDGMSLPAGGPARRQVLLNRLFRDRDIADRDGWVRRAPE
jgi:acyl phosphate:glycerol-3-phosphate acyltransferase